MPRFQFSIFIPIAVAAIFAAATAFAQSDTQGVEFKFGSQGLTEVDFATGETISRNGLGNYGDWLIKADLIRYNKNAGTVVAVGNVILTRQNIRLIADQVDLKIAESFARIENFRVGNGQGFVEGSLLEGDPNNFAFENAQFHPGEPGTFLFKAKAERIALIDQKEFELDGVGFRLGAVPFPPLPNINYPVDAETNLFDLDLDYSGHIGAVIGTELQLPVSEGLRAGVNLALTTERGILFGPTADYLYESDDYSSRGSLKTGFIDDSLVDTDTDVLNRPIDDERYFVEWQHKQRWDDTASISLFGRYWSDSEMTRDFYEDSFDDMEDPDSYLEANYNGNNWQASLFTRATPNDFQQIVERLPELRFQYFPTKFAKDWSQQGYVSFARLRQQSLTPRLPRWHPNYLDQVRSSSTSDTTNRFDAYYGVNCSTKLRDGVTLSAKAGARATYHDEDQMIIDYGLALNEFGAPVIDINQPLFQNADDFRVLGDIGFDLKTTAIATMEIDSDSWDIDAIRHVFEPVISYRYTPLLEGEKGLGFANPFDLPTVSNYLTPIDIEDRRDTDFLRESHKLRLELRNRIQTRHKEFGSRDLAKFDLGIDYDLDPVTSQTDDFSNVHFDFELDPANWLEVRLFTQYDIDESRFQEINSSIAFTDQGYWRLGVGNQYFRSTTNDLGFEQYIGFGEYFLSDKFKLFGIARYDSPSDTFFEQSFGILQRALGDYAVKYEIRFYDGNRREDDFSIRIGVDLFNE
ncbi:MAG: LPS assembly protein LptD [Verrucomicrobiota bacterium]